MKKFLSISLLFIILFTLPCYAEGQSSDLENLYSNQFESSGGKNIEENLPPEATEFLNDMGINPETPLTFWNSNPKNIFKSILDFLSSGGINPIKTALAIIGILLIFASVEGFLENSPGENISVFICFLASLSLLSPVFSLIENVKAAISGISTFMLGLVPVYAGVTLSAGNVASAQGFSSLLLLASEGISQFISFVFIPISSATMCLGICGSLSPIPMATKLCELIKKVSIWAMGIAVSVFLSILSFQNTITFATDNIGMRTSKAVLSSTIPVMGPAIAETLTTAKGCLGILRSGIGIYGAAAVGVLALPIIFELLLWRISMWLCSVVAETFNMVKTAPLFKAIDFCLSILLGCVIFTALLFIIALTISTKTG